ncbi:MAG TPA: ATP-dependent DNA ligase [Methanothermococcus okinawensis]|uniref:DNA ligase n=1 Tax=Methanothermococcus okinawensis TaxID=155863 RepID=A0A832ZKC8_9EURY|nr:ATP-dependent DNA ligase [Methanococcaceae archaeon]HIP84297.1 ATP-dependent DNA ligase [Methanothermococcus okinawensis]HIP91046.1 ATP-dependent DNA ligase [Methanothermococcus okinawensis]
MLFSDVCKVFKDIEDTSKRTEKIQHFIKLIKMAEKENSPASLRKICYLSIGRVYPEYENRELGIGPNMLIEAIKSIGIKEKDLLEGIKETGDIGIAIEKLSSQIKQASLFQKPLTLDDVYDTLKKVGEIEGESSQKKKIRHISNLFLRATPLERRYIARIILEDMRIGMNIPTILSAFSKYFGIPKEKLERIYAVVNDIGLIGEKLLMGVDIDKDEDLKLKLFRPIRPMLAQIAPSIKDAIEEIGTPQFETKYDGARVQIHRSGDKVKIYTRKLEDITNSLPEIVEEIKKLDKDNFIMEGECVAIDLNTGRPRPFQDILRRIRRKYNIDKMKDEINLRVYLFDTLYYKEPLLDVPLKERREILEDILSEDNDWEKKREKIEREIKSDKKIDISYKLVTEDVKKAEEFYRWSLNIGHEGVMIKNLKAVYTPGSRVRTMYKFKPTLESLDVVITKAKIGMGKRKDWYGSFEIAVKDEDGNLHPIGHVGSGLSEEELDRLSKKIESIKIEEIGDEVVVKPEIVLEVSYEEIQESDKYNCGYALRFPRVVRIREDRPPEDINTLEDVKRIFQIQKGRKKVTDKN